MIKGLQEILLIQSLHLSTIFVGSVTQIVIVGILIKELATTPKAKVKRLLIQMAIVLMLIEITLVAGFLASISESLSFLHVPELVISAAALIFGIIIVVNYYNFLNKKLIFLTILFGVISIFGVIETLFFDYGWGSILDFIGSTGVTISFYFLVIDCLIFCRTYRLKI